MPRLIPTSILLACVLRTSSMASSSETLFHEGTQAYAAAEYSSAATNFEQSAALQPSSGTLQNLGLAQWQRGQPGRAVLAWEQALWIDPFNLHAKTNLRFARKVEQIEAPNLAWYEVVSSWLPGDWWAWMAGVSLWFAVSATMLPAIFRLQKRTWHQAVAALGLMIFLLTLPAHLGVLTRSRIGFVLDKGAPLRLTPTSEAQVLTRLGAGEPARMERKRGNFVFVRTGLTAGWLDLRQFGLVSPSS